MIRSGNPDDHSIWLRRLPGSRPFWGDCEFTFDYDTRDYDWLVIYDDIPSRAIQRRSLGEELLACDPRNTLLITSEPSSIKSYGSRFLRQFAHVLTSQESWAISHPGVIRSQPALLWFYGFPGGNDNTRGQYDDMVAYPPLKKTSDISTVCSSKQMRHTLHHQRYQFVQRLKGTLPGLTVFGHGVLPLNDKADALDSFRYHLAIENHVAPHHWTEKLSDSFLGATLPFYYGCPNISDYFPEESLVAIDIFKFEKSLETIKEVIRDRWYEKRLPAILEARRLVLEEYSLFATIDNIVKRHRRSASPDPGPLLEDPIASIKSRHKVRQDSLGNKLLDLYEKTNFQLTTLRRLQRRATCASPDKTDTR